MLAFTYDRLGKYEKAITPWKELIPIKPDNAQADYWLGYAYEKLGRDDEATVEYNESLRIDPTCPCLIALRKFFDTLPPSPES